VDDRIRDYGRRLREGMFARGYGTASGGLDYKGAVADIRSRNGLEISPGRLAHLCNGRTLPGLHEAVQMMDGLGMDILVLLRD